jgi:hypothetical protein
MGSPSQIGSGSSVRTAPHDGFFGQVAPCTHEEYFENRPMLDVQSSNVKANLLFLLHRIVGQNASRGGRRAGGHHAAIRVARTPSAQNQA